MRVIICLFVFSFSANSFAQNISINTTGSANSTNSMLEVLQPSTTSGTSGLVVRHSGATTTAYGLWLEMTGAVTNKYAIIVPSGSGNVGIGTTTPPGPLSVVSTPTVDATAYGIYNEVVGTPSLSANRTYYGILNNLLLRPTENGFNAIGNGAYNQAYADGTYEFNVLRGAFNSAYSTSTAGANQDNIQGSFNQGYLSSTGVATNVYGSFSQGLNNENAVGTATVTALYGSRSDAVTNAGTTVSQYGAFNYAYKNTTGNVTTAFGSYNRVRNSDATGVGAIGTAYGVYSLIDKNAAGLDFTTAYGLYSNVSAGATRWGLYVTGEQNNYLSGNVGIGLTPSYKLHVTSASAWIAKFVSTAAANGGIYVDAASGYNANIALQENAVDKWYLGNRASNDRFSFIDASGSTEVLTILQGGFTGIGTITPGQELEVNGDICLPSSTGNKQIYTWSSADANWRIGMSATPGFTRALATSHVEYLTFANGVGQGFAVGDNVTGLSAFEVASSGSSYNAYFRGNVGIGQASPGAKLEVQGTFKLVDGTQALNRVLTSDANGLASWGTGTGLGEWTDGGAFLYPSDGDAEKVSIGQSDGTPLSGATPQLLVYTDANYGSSASVNFYNDENANSQTATILDLQFGNCTAVGADDKFIRFIRGLSTEVGSISGEVTYSTFTGAHVGQSDEDGTGWRPGMILSARGNPTNPTMGKAWVKIGLSTVANDKSAIGAYTNSEFPHQLADLDTTRPAYYYNALGEGMILVTDLGGDIEIGDYITTSERAGYGMKQKDDLLHNYTVAKATDSIKWSEIAVDPKYGFKWKLIACTYHGG